MIFDVFKLFIMCDGILLIFFYWMVLWVLCSSINIILIFINIRRTYPTHRPPPKKSIIIQLKYISFSNSE